MEHQNLPIPRSSGRCLCPYDPGHGRDPRVRTILECGRPVERCSIARSARLQDAWAAYADRARGTVFGNSLRRPESERTVANKNRAISFAAYRASVDLFPGDETTVFAPLMASLGYNPGDNSIDLTTPTGIVDDDAKMFFALTAAIFDAGIAVWDAKVKFDSVRPEIGTPTIQGSYMHRASSVHVAIGNVKLDTGISAVQHLRPLRG